MINPNPTYYKRRVLSSGNTVFSFDSVMDYNRFINETEKSFPDDSLAKQAIDNISGGYIQRNLKKSWFGTNDINDFSGDINKFLFNDDLGKFLEKARNNTVNVDVIDLDQQKSIKFTEQEIGIFSFDLASLGLIRVYEFFSYKLNKIVSGDLVKSKKTANGDLIFYHVYQPSVKRHEVEYNSKFNGYYSEVLNRLVDVSETIEVDAKIIFPEKPEIPQHDVERRQQLDENGNKKFSTTWKKSFVYIPKVEKTLPRIDIIVNAAYNENIKADTQMIYTAIAAITLAEKLSKSGVNYRMIASFPVRTTGKGTSKDVFTFVDLKKDGEPLDKNKMALLLADGRIYRSTQFRGFIATQYDAGFDSKISVTGIGSAINDSERIMDTYIDYLAAQDNPEDIQASKNRDSKIIFSGSLSEKDAQDQYNKIVRKISNVI